MSSGGAVRSDSYGDAGLLFADRLAMREWLGDPSTPQEGVWLVLGKRGGPRTVSASDALEEALCHGWIDGQMKRVDDVAYLKYFAPRRRGSVWSARNRTIAERLMAQGMMAPAGFAAVDAAKAGGTWDSPVAEAPGGAQISDLETLIAGREPAYTNWQLMSPSVKRTYTAFYLDAKTEPTRVRRLERILDRLDKNLLPM